MGMTGGASPVRVYLDANIFIYFLEEGGLVGQAVRRLFLAAAGRKNVFVTSELTLAEVLAPSEVGDRKEHGKYVDLIAANDAVDLRPVSRDILLATVPERLVTGHKLPDSIHCVTGQHASCTHLMSRDRGMSRLPSSIKWVDVDDSSVAEILEAMRA